MLLEILGKNKKKIINCFIILLLFTLCTYMFYNMLTGEMHSDYQVHLQNALDGDYYSLMSIILAFTFNLFKTNISIAVLMSLIVVTNVFVSATVLKRLLKIMGVEADYSYLFIVSAGLMFVCKLCIPDLSSYYFNGALVTQPWHNSTYLLMRPFAMATLLLFFEIQEKYLSEINIKRNIVFAVLIFLTNFAKPNFIIGFAPMMLISLIYDFIRTKGSSFKNAFAFGMCVVFGCTILLFQFGILYPGNDGGGVTVSIENFLDVLRNDSKFFFNLFMNLAFPMYALYLTIKNRKKVDAYSKRVVIQTWTMYGISLLEWLFIREIGVRATHQNFRWGEEFFAYFLFAISFCIVKKMKEQGIISEKENTIAIYTMILHMIFGLSYFLLLSVFKYFYLEI